MKRFIAAAVVPLVFLVGCGSGASVPAEDKEQPPSGVQEFQKFDVGGSDGATKVYRINNGGTDCIVADSYESIAITCDWANIS